MVVVEVLRQWHTNGSSIVVTEEGVWWLWQWQYCGGSSAVVAVLQLHLWQYSCSCGSGSDGSMMLAAVELLWWKY